jgi:lipopolysaccharide transport system permease protein
MAEEATAYADLPVRHSYERSPLLRDALNELGALVRHHELLRYMVSNSLRTTYNGTYFGYLWWLLDPVFQTFVYLAMVHVIMRQGGEQFALFVATSVLAWKFFSSAARNAIGVTESKAQLMRQVSFPRSVLPLSAVLAEGIRFLFGLVALVLFAMYFGIYPAPILAAIFVIAAVQLIFSLGLAYLLSAVNILFRDTYSLTQYQFQLWFYLSPGLYAVSFVPERYRTLYMLNPFATILPAYRDVLMDHKLPDFGALGIVAVASTVVLAAGFLVFVKLQPLFAKLQ